MPVRLGLLKVLCMSTAGFGMYLGFRPDFENSFCQLQRRRNIVFKNTFFFYNIVNINKKGKHNLWH